MEILDIISEDTIIFDKTISKKVDLFDQASSVLLALNKIKDKKKFEKDLNKREKEISTGIEDGFGIPHAKSKTVLTPTLLFFKTSEISDYEALDGTKIDCSFIIAVPKSDNVTYLDILSNLSRKLMHEEFRISLRNADSPKEVLEIIKKI